MHLGCAMIPRLIVLATALTVLATPARAQESTGPASGSVFKGDDIIFAAGVTAATLAIRPLDLRLARWLQSDLQARRDLRRLSWTVENITQPGAFIIGGGLYLVGRAANDRDMAELGLRGTEAIVIGLAFTFVVKSTVGRARPYVGMDPGDYGAMRGLRDSRYRSFTSGHALMAFAAATVVVDRTGEFWPGSAVVIAPLMYGGATLVAASRMYDNRHWASDVVAGGALGYFAGQKVLRYHRLNPDSRLDRWMLGVSMATAPDGRRVLQPLISRVSSP